MGIVSSVLVAESAQKDGRKWIQETHTDNVGLVYVIRYLAAVGLDTAAIMAARATQLGDDLTAAEIAANVARITADGSLATIVLNYSTALQSRTALRAAYLTATKVDAIMIGDFLSGLTDGQLQTLFSMTAGQVTTLRTNKLTPAAAAAATIRASTGA